jgi:hypothetical protein
LLIDIVPENVYNVNMAETYVTKPVAVRLNKEELGILERIRSELSRPGIPVSPSDALKVALHEWALAHPVKAESEV